MVARFIEGGYGVSEMEAHIEGDWVMYEDYAALELKVLAALSHLERAASAHKVHTKHAYVNMALRMLKDA